MQRKQWAHTDAADIQVKRTAVLAIALVGLWVFAIDGAMYAGRFAREGRPLNSLNVRFEHDYKLRGIVFRRQTGIADCGPTTLYNYAVAIGKPTVADMMSDAVRFSNSGTAPAELRRVSQSFGLPMHETTQHGLPAIHSLPSIVLAKNHYWLLLQRRGRKEFLAYDPSNGFVLLRDLSFDGWDVVVLESRRAGK